MPVCCCRIQRKEKATCGSWLNGALWCSLILAPACGYVIVNSVSWSVTNEVEEEELDSSSNEEVLPALLEDTTSIWKQSYPASVYKEEEEEMRSRPGSGRSKQISSPSRMFSYRRESVKGADSSSSSLAPLEQASRAARFLIHYNNWGFLATKSTQEKIQGAPFGNCLSISDGPTDNSTGIPFFYVTPKDHTVENLMKNPIASLTLPEAEGEVCRLKFGMQLGSIDFSWNCCTHTAGCRIVALQPNTVYDDLKKTIVEPDDPRCARLILTGQMITVSPEEMEFAKQALFSRHPVMREWPRHYEWFFMKMNIEHVWLQNWYGGIITIAPEEYFKAVPSKA